MFAIQRESRVKDQTFGIFVSIAAGGTTLLVFGKHIWAAVVAFTSAPVRWVKEQSEAARMIRSIVDRQEEIGDKVKRIESEVKPNGGASLNDKITRIETLVADGDQSIRALLTDAPDGYLKADSTGGWTWANRTLCKMMGRQCEELYGRGWEQCIDSGERESIIAEWDRCIEVGREFFANVHCHTPGGTRVFLQIHSYVLKNKITGIVSGCIARCSVIPPEMERKSS